jgi:ketosteroid isomerase-like protein
MTVRTLFSGLVLVGMLSGCSAPPTPRMDLAALHDEVWRTEQAFARTMAARDLAAFSGFVADEAVFESEGGALRGRAQVVAGWRRLFDGATAPFSWEPAQVEVLDSGTLASSSGPVRDAQGVQVAEFHSVWRRDGPGVWHIVLDAGCTVCRCAQPK